MTQGRDAGPHRVVDQPSRAVFATLMAFGALLALITMVFAFLMLLFGRGPEGGVNTTDFVLLGALSLAATGLLVSAYRYRRLLPPRT